MLRSEQQKENTWDLDKIYPNIEAYQEDYDTVRKLMNKIKEYKNHILDSSKSLLEILELDTKVERTISKMAN